MPEDKPKPNKASNAPPPLSNTTPGITLPNIKQPPKYTILQDKIDGGALLERWNCDSTQLCQLLQFFKPEVLVCLNHSWITPDSTTYDNRIAEVCSFAVCAGRDIETQKRLMSDYRFNLVDIEAFEAENPNMLNIEDVLYNKPLNIKPDDVIRKRKNDILSNKNELEKRFKHSSNFHWIEIDGKEYEIASDLQAQVIRVLYHRRLEGIKKLTNVEIFYDWGDKSNKSMPKMKNMFKNSNLKDTVIMTNNKGHYWLNL